MPRMHCGVCKIVFTCRQAESLSSASLAPVHSAKLEGLDLNVLKLSPLINSRLGNEDLLYVCTVRILNHSFQRTPWLCQAIPS